MKSCSATPEQKLNTRLPCAPIRCSHHLLSAWSARSATLGLGSVCSVHGRLRLQPTITADFRDNRRTQRNVDPHAQSHQATNACQKQNLYTAFSTQCHYLRSRIYGPCHARFPKPRCDDPLYTMLPARCLERPSHGDNFS